MATIDSDMHDLRDSLAARPGSLLLLAGPGADRLAIEIAAAWGTRFSRWSQRPGL